MDTTKEDTNKLSMTLPPAVMAALKAEGTLLDMSAGEWLKHQTIAAYTQPSGVMMKLMRVATAKDNHPELALGMEGGGL